MVAASALWIVPFNKKANLITAPAARGELVLTVSERGELESSKSTDVICEIEGGAKIATIVEPGTLVKKGDELCKFDVNQLNEAIGKQEVQWEQADGKAKAAKSDFEAQKDKSDQEVAKAELAYKLAKIDNDSYEVGDYQVALDKQKGAIELAKKDLQEAEDSLEFTRGLAKKGLAQLEQIRALELGLENKKYNLREKEAELMVLQKFTRTKKLTELQGKADETKMVLEQTKKIQGAALAKAESDMKAAAKTAELEKRTFDRTKEQLSKSVLKAPQDGIVIYSQRRYYYDGGESGIRPGAQVYFQQPIVTLPDLNQMQVKMRVHESVVKKVKKGQPATLQIEALPGVVLHGKVVSIATQAQQQWRSGVKEYETIISVDDLPPDAGLRPGMSADVKILLKTVPDALTVPVQAVTEFDGKHVVYVETATGLERREVKVGENNETLVQILEGLGEGERVALDARVRAAAELKTEGKEAKPEDKEKEKDKAKGVPVPGGK
jgi:RND family efflux transporter MFP subunit